MPIIYSLISILGKSERSWSIFKNYTLYHLAQTEGPKKDDSHLQQPSGPADVSKLLSVSEANVGSVDMEDTSLTDEDDNGCWEPLITAAPVLKMQAVLGLPHFSSSLHIHGLPCISTLSIPRLCVLFHLTAYQ